MLAEEVGGFVFFAPDGQIQWCLSLVSTRHNYCIHICTIGDEKFGDFRVTIDSCIVQRSRPIRSLRIHIRASSQVLFDCFDVPFFGSIKQCIQFFTRLAAVLAKEIGGFGSGFIDGKI